eukprot:gene5204-2253_t
MIDVFVLLGFLVWVFAILGMQQNWSVEERNAGRGSDPPRASSTAGCDLIYVSASKHQEQDR